ncbi:hypothetical protein [Photobacterium sp. DNB22_13_2]
MIGDKSLTTAFLLLVEQIKQLERLLTLKQEQLADLIKHQHELEQLHAQCERNIASMIVPLPSSHALNSKEAPAFKVKLRQSWSLKMAYAKQRAKVYRLKQRIIRLEKRVETSLALKTNAMATIKTREGSQKLQTAIEILLVKNQLWLT